MGCPFLLVLPFALTIGLLLTVVLLPAIPLTRLSYSSEPPEDESGWFHGDASEEAGVALFAIPAFINPFLIPFAISLDVG